MELHEIISVTATDEDGVYIATVDITDMGGERYETNYVSRAGDIFGLAPVIRAAVEAWIADGKPVLPYEPPPPPPLPPLSARQLRLGLVAAGIMPSQVDTAIAEIQDANDRAIAEIEWEYATQFERDHPLIDQVGAALGLTPEQIDDMWQAAIGL